MNSWRWFVHDCYYRRTFVALVVILCSPRFVGGVILSSSGDKADPNVGITADARCSGVGEIYQFDGSGDLEYSVTGALISKWHVLTCAHALMYPSAHPDDVTYLDPGEIMFRVGGAIMAVEDYTVHPDFDPETSYADIAVLVLRRPAQRVNHYAYNRGQIDELQVGKVILVGAGMSGSALGGLEEGWPMGTNRRDRRWRYWLSDEKRRNDCSSYPYRGLRLRRPSNARTELFRSLRWRYEQP